MKLLLSIIGDSFNILSKNLTLLWPFIGLIGVLMVLSQWIPETMTLSFNPLSLALAGVVLAICFAFAAGMYHMAYQAAYRAIHPKPNAEKTANPLDSFTLVSEFFPGVSAFFPSFFFGGLIQIGFLVALSFTFQYLLDQIGGLPTFLSNLSPTMSEAETQRFLLSLKPEQLQQVMDFGMLGLGALITICLFNLLTMLWPAYAIADDSAAPAAYLKSIGRFFKDPLRLIAIGVTYSFACFLLLLMPAGSNIFISGLKQLLLLMAHIWMMVMVCYYVIATHTPSASEKDGNKLSVDA